MLTRLLVGACLVLVFLTHGQAQITTPVGTPVATQSPQQPQGSNVPVPDPTVLTTQASEKAVAALKELLEARLKALEENAVILRDDLTNRPEAVTADLDDLQALLETQIIALKELVAQQFIGVDQNFEGRDTALAAALLAQKTAVDEQNRANALSIAKSDAATTKQIDTIGLNIGNITEAIDAKVDDLRTRVQAIESRAIGASENRTETNDNWGWVFGAIGAIAALIAIIGALVVVANRPHVNSNGATAKA